MPVSEQYDFYSNAVPINGTSAVHTLTFSGTITGGTFALDFDGQVTSDITWVGNDDAALVAAIDAALEALSNIGTGDVTCADSTLTNGIGNVTITFGANLKNLAVPVIVVDDNSLTGEGADVAVDETTPGVTATARNAAVSDTLLCSEDGKVYVNNGAALDPVWVSLQ